MGKNGGGENLLEVKARKSLFVCGVVLLLILSLALAGCSSAPGQGEKVTGDAGEGGQQDPGKGSRSGAVMIQIKGSDSEVNLVQKLAEEFMAENPQVQIAVTGGGSGVGIAAIIDGTIDIANSSRPMKNEEIEKARANGIDPVPVRFAVDGIAVIVNEKNPVGTLSVEEIGAIYRGEIKNWSAVGGANAKINLFGRQSNSGTYVFFMESVLKGDYSPEMRNMGGNADIVEAVKSDVTGIGYVAIGYTKEGDSIRPGLKVLNVSQEKGKPGVTPVELSNITSGAYPITRPLYQFVAGQPQGALRDFVLFELSEKGQEIVLGQGFYPLSDADREFNKNSLK